MQLLRSRMKILNMGRVFNSVAVISKAFKNFVFIGLLTTLLLVAILGYFYVNSTSKGFLGKKVEGLPRPTPAYDADQEKYTWDIMVLASDLEVPWDMAFARDGRLFVTERPGRLKVLNKEGAVQAVATLTQVVSVGESGLTGLTLHPDFDENGHIYLYYTYRQGGSILNRVSRFTYTNGRLTEETPIVDSLPGGVIHNGGRLRFGPDGKLWVLTGDAARPELAQNMKSLAGKVLRVNNDGSTPSDNPFKNSPVYSLGHRNPQGLTFHPLTEELILTEHGETAHDEVNLIKAGGNYGWPESRRCDSSDPRFQNPILCSGQETWAPSGVAFLGREIWRLRNSLFLAGLRGQMLERVEIINGRVAERETIIKSTYGRLRGVVAGPDGNIYVSTSNLDGRGNPQPGDDKILKITPRKVP